MEFQLQQQTFNEHPGLISFRMDWLDLLAVQGTLKSPPLPQFRSINSSKAPGGATGKESTCHCKRCKRHRFDPWVGKIPWRRTWQPTPLFLPGESHGQRSLVGYSLWGHRESDTTEATERVHAEVLSKPVHSSSIEGQGNTLNSRKQSE